jgi:hypothetical protein
VLVSKLWHKKEIMAASAELNGTESRFHQMTSGCAPQQTKSHLSIDIPHLALLIGSRKTEHYMKQH